MYQRGGMKGSLNAQAHIDVKLLAGIDRAMERMGVETGGSMSGLLVEMAFMLMEVLKANGRWEDYGDIGDALEYLESRGYSMAQLKDRKRSMGIARAFQADVQEEINMTLPGSMGRSEDSIIEETIRNFRGSGRKKEEEVSRSSLKVELPSEEAVVDNVRGSVREGTGDAIPGMLPEIKDI